MSSGRTEDITVQVTYDGQQHELRTYSNEYRSLMMLIYDRIYIEGFGECLGMGKCGTCVIEITEKKQNPTAYERNGDANLLRAGRQNKNICLSCQLMIDEQLDGLTVRILI
ncbi:2Fe-2S iron-sulfur cluster-binding protein [Mucilaginibacter aquariorum]|uniref:2Fe-2S iron-sulfur cluster-binding protein n=1 Tax=Mucilaginibacter aquariorum TaxID=2967225 RepID=A0ABT1T166_9SPHI|nr:2Fe-2S iron-sulfur cluster-binding protein [Mucilaginibacter aquariorum]MCQ6958351.1 2Fe-2S iron-sulfur cluster-binding protein [Mucilaginibacter aquariorum]